MAPPQTIRPNEEYSADFICKNKDISTTHHAITSILVQFRSGVALPCVAIEIACHNGLAISTQSEP